MKTAYLTFVLLAMVMLTACSSANPQPIVTPVDISAMQTAAVQTVMANITQTAAAMPTETPAPAEAPAPSATPTETPTPTVTVTQSTCDDSIWISDVSVSDGTQMTAGQAFVKTWKIKNTGTCTWSSDYQIIFSHGEKMGGLPAAIGAEVQPGAEVEISINLTAPAKTGNYGGYWRMANNNGFAFGQRVSVIIVVP